MESGHSDTTTRGIRVRVGAQYLPEHSDPDDRHFVFAYRVIISNEGDSHVKLLSRFWIVRDAENHKNEIHGSGVVGKFPELEPGQSYEYVSGCPIPTCWGTMEGRYRMQELDGGDTFDVAIGRFFLAPNTAPVSKLTSQTRTRKQSDANVRSSPAGPTHPN